MLYNIHLNSALILLTVVLTMYSIDKTYLMGSGDSGYVFIRQLIDTYKGFNIFIMLSILCQCLLLLNIPFLMRVHPDMKRWFLVGTSLLSVFVATLFLLFVNMSN